MEINRKVAKETRLNLNEKVKDLLEGYTVEVIPGGNFTDTDMEFKIRVVPKGNVDRELRQLHHWAEIYGLDLDKVVSIGNKRMKLTGFNPKASKNCFKMTDLNTNKVYICDEENAKRYFEKAKENKELEVAS